MRLRLHHFIPASFANGPGCRAVLWTQGCSLDCEGCFNVPTHSFKVGNLVEVRDIVERLMDIGDSIEGITISGGEPFQQVTALRELLTIVGRETSLSIIVFTGYGWPEIQRNDRLLTVAKMADVLIAGRYNGSKLAGKGLWNLPNKTVHFFTERYTRNDLEQVPESEIIIGGAGVLISTGVTPVQLGYNRIREEQRKNNVPLYNFDHSPY